jgi:hypothetical protein
MMVCSVFEMFCGIWFVVDHYIVFLNMMVCSVFEMFCGIWFVGGHYNDFGLLCVVCWSLY